MVWEDLMIRDIVLRKCSDYSLENLKREIYCILNKFSGPESIRNNFGDRVLIKPNILAGADPSQAAVTHPAVIDAVICYFVENGFKVKIGDSPAVENLKSASIKSGIDEVVKKYGIEYADFKNTSSFFNNEGELVKKFEVVNAYVNNDYIVNIAKLKTHSQMYYTGAMKNLFGFIYHLEKSKFHFRFQERENFAKMIVDLNCLIRPNLSIMDAVVSMQGEGPRNGKPYKSSFIAGSESAVALDLLCSQLIGYDPESIPILNHALKRKLDHAEYKNDFSVDVENLDEFFCKDFKKIERVQDVAMFRKYIPSFMYEAIRKVLIPRPFFLKKKCRLCMKCVNICSANALNVLENKNGKYINIDYDKCIRCYCCGEVCPYDAIEMKKKLLNKKA